MTPVTKGKPPSARLFLLIFLVLFLLPPAPSQAAEEESLLDLWQHHLAAPDNHEATLKACADFTAAHPADPLLPVIRGLQAWHQLRAGHKGEGLALIAADLTAPAGPVTDGARRLALGWLTRADRETVAAALQAYYRQQVAYPKSLALLPAATRPPAADRFGKPWLYQLTGFAKVPGFTDQKYSLTSAVLGDTSDLQTALRLPYAARLTATPAQIASAPGAAPSVKFSFPATKSTALIGVGQAASDVYLAYIGTQIIVVCDYTHWKIFPRP